MGNILNNTISATDLNKHSGQILQMAQKKPVIVEKTGQPSVAILSYEYFVELEDFYFGKVALKIDKKGEYLSCEESEKFLKNAL